MDYWHLLYPNDNRKSKYNPLRVSNVCVLVCYCNWISELHHLLSIGTAKKWAKQRHHQMESPAGSQRYDILFKQLSRGLSQYHDSYRLHLLLSTEYCTEMAGILVRFSMTSIKWFNTEINFKLNFHVFPCRLRRFPPKPRLLTSEEFHAQSVFETTKALEELKAYCSSPEAKPWRMMTRLKDPQRWVFLMETLNYSDSEDKNEITTKRSHFFF